MILSILICVIPKRFALFQSLYQSLLPLPDGVEIIIDNSMDISTGAKRNDLIRRSKGEFVVFIDDDDLVSENYISLILSAIKSNQKAHCIGIQGIITTDGSNEKQWFISKDFLTWHEKNNIYYRTPNHISPVRRDIAVKVGFPDIYYGEDYAYSMGILPYLKIEVLIKENIYHYKYMSK